MAFSASQSQGVAVGVCVCAFDAGTVRKLTTARKGKKIFIWAIGSAWEGTRFEESVEEDFVASGEFR